jgi:outer membrane protein assembly factor BamB
MKSYPALGRLLIATFTAGIFAFIYFVRTMGGDGTAEAVQSKQAKADADGWIMYGGSPSRNMANTTVKGLPVEWSIGKKSSPNVKWVADLGSKSYGGPIVAAGRVIVGTNNQGKREKFIVENGKKVDLVDPATGKAIDKGILMCFDEKTGAFNWQTVFHKLPSGLVHDWPEEGLCSSPVVEGDKMYYVSNRCEVVCSDLTGKIQWKLDMMGPQLGVEPHNLAVCSPLIVGEKLWVVTANGVNKDHINVPAPKAPSFIALDKKTGQNILWQDNTPTASLLVPNNPGFKPLINQGKLIQHGQWSNPSYAKVDGQDQVVFPGGDGWIYSFDLAGKLLWKFDCNPKDAVYELGVKGTRNDFIATPVIYKNKVYIGTGQDPEHEKGVGHLWCISMDKRGDVSPELVVDASVFPPKTKPNPNSAKVWHYGGKITDPKDRKKLQRNDYFGRTMSTCAIHDDLVYVADLGGILSCLDAKDGKVYWEHDTEGVTWSSPYYADGKVYLGNDQRTVFVFAHGKEKKLLAENEMRGRVRATPVAANGTLYVMTENKLYAIAGK